MNMIITYDMLLKTIKALKLFAQSVMQNVIIVSLNKLIVLKATNLHLKILIENLMEEEIVSNVRVNVIAGAQDRVATGKK